MKTPTPLLWQNPVAAARQSAAIFLLPRKHGTFQRWHENGASAERMEMRQGQPEGLTCAYYPSGFLKAQARLHDGKLEEQRFWPDGEVRSGPR
jgi:antitoxin component YwqK of YwqJK toxin-antitoxin module